MKWIRNHITSELRFVLGTAYFQQKRVLVVGLDVTKVDDVKAAFAKAIEKFGRVDAVVNNAGYVSLID